MEGGGGAGHKSKDHSLGQPQHEAGRRASKLLFADNKKLANLPQITVPCPLFAPPHFETSHLSND